MPQGDITQPSVNGRPIVLSRDRHTPCTAPARQYVCHLYGRTFRQAQVWGDVCHKVGIHCQAVLYPAPAGKTSHVEVRWHHGWYSSMASEGPAGSRKIGSAGSMPWLLAPGGPGMERPRKG
ncbi:hypothetical protein GCM10009546_62410 [Actinomadura livida]|uniref:Uncharacterized protein n=1 Tax=Actinomadura livida TaxID=79909 RepID=A0ABN1FII4_9ACTN